MVKLNIKLPDDFLSEETRSGFLVTEERKKVWAVELDLLKKLDGVCKKYELNYVVGAGTLLGAIRHQGFIPWDDDIDVYMLRPAYDQLMNLIDEFQEPYFMQNYNTEKNLFRTHAQLRNSDTTGYSMGEYYRDINKGIFIDIFPLDGVSDSVKEDARQKRINSFCFRMMNIFNGAMEKKTNVHGSEWLKKNVKKAICKIIKKEQIIKLYENNLKKFSNKGIKIWGNRTLVFECPKSRRPIEDWQNWTTAPFEFLEVPIPSNYDAILRQQYGNYMIIPEDKNGSRHGKLIVSADFSYKTLQGGN